MSVKAVEGIAIYIGVTAIIWLILYFSLAWIQFFKMAFGPQKCRHGFHNCWECKIYNGRKCR